MQPQTSHTCNLSRIILHAPTPSPVALCCRTAICASAHAQCQCNVRRKPASLAKLRRLPPHHARCWDGAYLARRRVAAAIANHRLVGMIAPHKCGCADRLSCVAQLAHACILFFSRIHILASSSPTSSTASASSTVSRTFSGPSSSSWHAFLYRLAIVSWRAVVSSGARRTSRLRLFPRSQVFCFVNVSSKPLSVRRRPTDRLGRDSHPRHLGRRVTGSDTRVDCSPGDPP